MVDEAKEKMRETGRDIPVPSPANRATTTAQILEELRTPRGGSVQLKHMNFDIQVNDEADKEFQVDSSDSE